VAPFGHVPGIVRDGLSLGSEDGREAALSADDFACELVPVKDVLGRALGFRTGRHLWQSRGDRLCPNTGYWAGVFGQATEFLGRRRWEVASATIASTSSYFAAPVAFGRFLNELLVSRVLERRATD